MRTEKGVERASVWLMKPTNQFLFLKLLLGLFLLPRPKELSVRLGCGPCPEEQAFLSKRKQVVAAALKKALQLDQDLQEDEV